MGVAQMKKYAAWIAAWSIVFALSAFGQSVGQKEAPSTPGGKMDELFDFWNRLDQPGFAVVVVKDGQVVTRKVYGLACQEHAVPITPNTVFNAGPVAKAFVGMAVALLEKQGKLALDDAVRKYIPEIPDYGVPLQLRHLLYQTSGLRDWPSVLRLNGRDNEEVTFGKVLEIVKAQKRPAFTPGERFQDSDTNYDLLAETIRRVTGQAFSDWAWENIFKPLKMTRTQFRDNYRSILDDQAFSYNYTRREYLRGIDNLSVAGSHSLFVSINDLTKWLLNLGTGAVGGPDILAKMFTAGRLNDGRGSGFGYGLNVDARTGRAQVSIIGKWAGSQAGLAFFPDRKFGCAVLANWDYPGTEVENILQGIIATYDPAPPEPVKKSPPAAAKKPVKVKPEKLDLYAGDYRMGPGQVFTISRSGDQLMFGYSGTKYPLTTLSETEFLLAFAEARITFQKNKEGKVGQFVWSQGGSERIVPKIALVKPTPQELREYAGAYANDEIGVRYIVELRGEALILSGPGIVEARLAPDERDRFTTSSRTLPMVIFERDGQNRVAGFSIDSDAVRDLIFKRAF